MVKSLGSCPVPTNAGKILTYDQYYTGHKDDDQRKNGHGENHWSGPESLEWYTGSFLHDTMHGVGEYRTRYRGDKGVFVTYEGHFYANRMHGYGTMSYPNGAVFTGLFHKDMRWGPGIESQACLREDVGLWRGTQLVRLAWQPATPNVALDLCIGLNGKACVEPHRIVLAKRIQTIGEANSAIELLKQSGSDPISASVNWTKLYPKTCTDLASQLCYVEVFEHDYYNSRIIPTLEKVTGIPDHEKNENQQGGENFQTTGTFYAWNNNEMVTHMMKHSFKHENQRAKYGIELKSVLSGPRNQFKQAGKHEIDCRTLLMASYLGHLYDVAQLVNDLNVHTDVADIQGNTALMYATCGDQVDIIHFLVEAGADVNSYCDTCCTPLGVALMRFVCATKDISASQMVQALIPPPIVPAPPPVTTEQMPTEWHMSRGVLVESPRGLSSKPVAKASVSVKKVQPNPSKNSVMSVMKKKTELAVPKSASFADDDADEKLSEEKRLYDKINIEFSIRVTDLFSPPILLNPIPYLFKINDMIIEVDAFYEEQNKPPENNPKKAVLKVIKDTVKPSKEIMWQNSDGDGDGSIDSVEKAKNETLSKIMMTILQLLSDGAAPCLVRCPQPALLIATVSGCPNLVRQLVSHGIDVNEVYPQSLHYTALDVAVSQPFTYENLELVRALLECGAKTDHILRYAVPDTADPAIPEVPGPTLLHAVLARKTENDVEEELQQKLLEMLLEYKCNPMIQFKGRSSADVAMTKNMDVFDQFLKCPRTNLNAAINDANETVLLKIFSKPFYTTIPTTERLQTVTNLLLFGADPFLECQTGQEIYKNIFVFAKKTLTEMESTQKPGSPKDNKADAKVKKPEKPKKDMKLSVSAKLGADDIGDYKQALDVMTECARILHVRWLQGQLLKELLEVVVKFKHRQWNMILPEHKNKKSCGLWLTCGRTLEIWKILKTTKRKVFEERRVLKHVLCLVSFYSRRSVSGFKRHLTSEEKDDIESNVRSIVYKMTEPLLSDEIQWSRPYVMPELIRRDDERFNVCFECSLPFEELKDQIKCSRCKLLSFCSLECMKANINRAGCHPCSEFLMNKYFSSPEKSVESVVT